jgi:RNA polymerase sigma factor (sigma-70 family)
MTAKMRWDILTEEHDLVIQSKQGNADAYSQLVKRYKNAVYAVAIARLGDTHVAEDVAQETFVKAWYNLNRLTDVEKFCGWLTTIARNSAEDWARKNKPVTMLNENHFMDKAINFTEEEVLRHERKETVWHALSRLDEKYRIVSILYFISELNSREIGAFLGISLSAVESRLRRSKDKLKKELFELAEEMLVTKKLGKEFENKVMKRIIGVSCINFPVRDVVQSAEWYVTHLGCILVRKPTPGGNAIIKLGEEGPTVFLHEESERTPLHFTRNGRPASLFELRTEDIDSFYQQLKEEGVQVSERYDNYPCSKYFDAVDPDGNTITIAEWFKVD